MAQGAALSPLLSSEAGETLESFSGWLALDLALDLGTQFRAGRKPLITATPSTYSHRAGRRLYPDLRTRSQGVGRGNLGSDRSLAMS